ncbi:hypothetical protein ACIBK8_27025 [Streptomyces sp. NPDC050161]|uniref:hypothetical protein n=1 Tax=Streptomyces sp. NPDC050161 TaxID=3365604 RepID=UPI00379F6097
MFERTERDTDRPRVPGALEMPRQSPPIDRSTGAAAGAAGDTAGVEADGFLTGLLSKILPI